MIVRTQLAARLYEARQARNRIFADFSEGFGEPAWDLLLSLYVFRGEMPIADLYCRVSVNAGVAQRWVQWLVARDLFRVDGTVAVLTIEGRRLIDKYLDWVQDTDTTHDSGLS